jgi:glycosyltransferase involved in cell wall biosynthesis
MQPHPVGGYKVQYEYAGELAKRGHRVTIIHSMTLSRRTKFRSAISCVLTLLKHAVEGHRVIPWFVLDRRVKLHLAPILTGKLLPSADVTVLTACHTSTATRRPTRRAGHFLQIVYDYEYWMTGTEETRAQMSAAFRREDVALVSTSSAVTSMLDEMRLPSAALVTAGIDLNLFEYRRPHSSRLPVIGFATRSDPVKAMPVLVEACEIVHGHRDDVSFVSYGQTATHVPEFVCQRGFLSPAAIRDFYNDCMIFVLPSDYEGWGLPAVEAMACGACLVSTANGGVEDFATDHVNALVVPIRDPQAIAAAIEELLDNPAMRAELVENALQKSQELGLGDAVDRLEQVLKLAANGTYRTARVEG